MIRLQAETETGRALDPICGCLTAAAPIFRARGYKRLSFLYDSVARDYPIDGSFASSGLSAEDRMSIAKSELFVIPCEGFTPQGSERFNVTLINDALCAPECFIVPSNHKARNGKVGRDVICYSEALNPSIKMSQVSVDTKMVGSFANGLRPFYAYLCTGMDSKDIIIHGPDCKVWEDAVAYGCTAKLSKAVGYEDMYENRGTVDVFFRSIPATPETSVKVPEVDKSVRDSNDYNIGAVILTDGKNKTFLQLTQRAPSVGGVPLNCNDYLRALLIGVAIENSKSDATLRPDFEIENGAIIIHVQQRGRYCYLDEAATNFYASRVKENPIVQSIAGNFEASDSTIFYVPKDSTPCRISAHAATRACYALSLATWVALKTDKKLSTALSAIDGLFKSGVLKVDGAGYLSGIGDYANKPVFINTTTGVYAGDLSRTTIAAGNFASIAEGEVVIFGFDPWSENKGPGPDHYVVATKKNGELIVIFDPYRAGDYFTCGAVITKFLSKEDSLIMHFNDSAMALINKEGGVYNG